MEFSWSADSSVPYSSLRPGVDEREEISIYSISQGTSATNDARWTNPFDSNSGLRHGFGPQHNEEFTPMQGPSSQWYFADNTLAVAPASHYYVAQEAPYETATNLRYQSLYPESTSSTNIHTWQTGACATGPSARVTRNVDDFAIVPQRLYRVPHYAEPFYPQNPIQFSVGTSNGISVRAAFEENYAGLNGSYDELLLNGGSSISLRFEWPGYLPYSHQITTKDYRSNPRLISRAKLAHKVAKELKRFIRNKIVDEDAAAGEASLWKLGRRFITIDRLVLVRLEHVSRASYQPVFRLVY